MFIYFFRIGNWRLMEHDYHFRVLSHLLGLIESNSWLLGQIPIGECLSELSDIVPRFILNHLIQLYLTPIGDFNENGLFLFYL